MSHATLTGLNLHQPFHYNQETDPGAVGAGLWWWKKSIKALSQRNATNTGWITALVSTSSNALPPGTDWTGFLAAYAATDPGDSIELANEPLVQESNLFIQKAITIKGSGPLSSLKLLADVTLSGSTQQIAIGYGDPVNPIPAVTLKDFIIEHDRVAGGPSMRTLAISVFGGTSNLRIIGINFKNITSDCIIVRNEGFSGGVDTQVIDGVYVFGCIVEDWYETFFNIREGSAKNLFVVNNTCTLLAGGHPNGAVSRPYAVLCNLEEVAFPGLVENFHVENNTFVSTLYDFSLGVGGQAGSGSDFNNSIGFTCRQNNNPDHRYHRIHVEKNLFNGWDLGLYHIQTQQSGGSTLFPGLAYIYYLGNTWQNNGSNIATIDDWGEVGDIVQFGDNDLIINNGNNPLLLPGSGTANDPAHVSDIVQSPPNRVT
jgi:hypothetical protein